ANNLLGIQYLTDSLKFQEDSVKYVRYLDALEEEKAELGGDKETPTDNRRAEGSVNDRRDRQITQGNPRQQNARGNQLQSKIPFVPEPVKPKISADSIQVLNSDLKFQLGNLFFSELNVADSAEYYYQSVINNHSESKILPRAIYALGALYSTLDQNEKADSLFQIIYDNYNDLDIAQDAAKKLNLPYYDEEVDPAAEMFAKAEEKYLSSSIQDAIGDYRMIASSFPESPFAPKALYTVGYIFENELNLMDSAAVVYDSLSSQYETTEYARASKPKLIEWRKIELAKQAVADSIANAEKPVEEQPEISMENTEEKQSETVAESPKIDENLIDESESAVDSSKIEEAIIDEIDESKLTPEELQKLRQERLKKEFLPALKDSLQKKLDPKSKPKVKEKEDQ
ncbi:MAG: hypothetical protein K9G34_09860, partial [Melioribacteraceae bacterium]|nr:hypothetical protein [Melioribacteraceae bacterium]